MIGMLRERRVNDRNTMGGRGYLHGMCHTHLKVASSTSKQNLLSTSSVRDLTQSFTSMKSVEGSCECRKE